ncbi:aminotransferase [Histoplasma capsulatum H143]|uniref:Aminotransferase n=1 Tax=Ajellomyces capsulatus (strain H143) TaxID=544712 RepID=C6H8J3_AJECH|nr:aminotransferase [Histoplasma capsulatum H143]
MTLGYENVIISGLMSKAYSLAGIQVGWLTSPNVDLVRACEAWRAYTIVSASQIDRQIALYELHEGRLHNLLKRNNALARHNLALLEGFIEQNRWAYGEAGACFGDAGGAGDTGGDEREFKDTCLNNHSHKTLILWSTTNWKSYPRKPKQGAGDPYPCSRLGADCGEPELGIPSAWPRRTMMRNPEGVAATEYDSPGSNRRIWVPCEGGRRRRSIRLLARDGETRAVEDDPQQGPSAPAIMLPIAIHRCTDSPPQHRDGFDSAGPERYPHRSQE